MTGKNRRIEIKNKSGQLLHGDLTDKIIGICYDIHRQYGSGHKESVYQNAMEEKLQLSDINFSREYLISVKSEDTDKILGSHRLDFVIDNKVVVEVKAIKFTYKKLEQQLYSYLRNSQYKVGLMINFGSVKLYIKRVILTDEYK